MGDIELRQPGYVAELIDVFNKAKRNNPKSGTFSGGSTIDEASTSSAQTTDDHHNSRTTESLSEATSSFSHDLPVLLSDYMRQSSSSCQWSSPEAHSDSAEHCSIDVFATLRPKTKCACICNQKNCEFLKKPFDAGSGRNSTADIPGNQNSHLKKVFTLLRDRKSFHHSYEVPKNKLHSRWWKRRRTLGNNLGGSLDRRRLTPTPLLQGPASLGTDELDYLTTEATPMPVPATFPFRKGRNGTNGPVPEVIEMNRMIHRPSLGRVIQRVASHEETNGTTTHLGISDEQVNQQMERDLDDDVQSTSENKGMQTSKSRVLEWLNICRSCKCSLSPVRIVLLVLGSVLFLAGISYDFGVKHGVDSALESCWTNLMAEYIDFGKKFLSYNEIMLSSQKYPRDKRHVATDRDQALLSEQKDYWTIVAEKDPKFVHIMEGLEVSVQIHFFSLVDSVAADQVHVRDQGPLHLKLTFTQANGFRVDYVRDKSNLTLSTPFHVYDLMKMFSESNDLPHFGLHIKDFYDTTPAALLNVVVNALKKFKISASFLDSLQMQTHSNLRRRRSKAEVTDLTSRWEVYENIIRSIFLPVPPDTSKLVHIPVTLFEKNLTLEYKDLAKVSGIPSYRFSYRKMINNDNKSKYYSSGLDKWNSRRENMNMYTITNRKLDNLDTSLVLSDHPLVLDLGPAIQNTIGNIKLFGQDLRNYPFWVSSPHFSAYRSNEFEGALPTSNTDATIRGFSPDPEEHGSFLFYHPVLGVPMNASVAVQFGIRPPAKMLHAGKLVPVVWARIQLAKIPASLWHIFWFATHVRIIVICVLTLSGILLMVLAVTCCYSCREEHPPEPAAVPV